MAERPTATPPAPPVELELSPVEGSPRLLAVLRNRNFLYIFLAQGLSQIAYHAVNFALVVLIETLTHSSTAVSLIILAFSLPAIIFSGLAGVLVDRAPKRQVMVVTTALRTLVLAGLIAVDTAWPPLPLFASLYLATFLFSTLSQFFGPAEGAMIPQLVGRRSLIAANSLFNLTFFASQLIGFAVAGPVLAKLIGLRPLFAVATVLYIGCTVLVWLLPRDTPPVQAAARPGRLLATVWHDLAEGAQTIWRDPLLIKAIAYLSLASSAFLMLGAIGPAYVTRVLSIPAEDLGFILAPAGLGIIGGILLVNRYARPENRERMIDLGIMTSGLASLIFALIKPAFDAAAGLAGTVAPVAPVVACVVLVAAAFGGGMAYILVPSQTVLQERAPEQMRARVFAAFYTVSSAASLGPVLFAGALSDLFGVTTVLLLVAIGLLTIGLLSLRRGRAGREAARP
jgi:MFS family permease